MAIHGVLLAHRCYLGTLKPYVLGAQRRMQASASKEHVHETKTCKQSGTAPSSVLLRAGTLNQSHSNGRVM